MKMIHTSLSHMIVLVSILACSSMHYVDSMLPDVEEFDWEKEANRIQPQLEKGKEYFSPIIRLAVPPLIKEINHLLVEINHANANEKNPPQPLLQYNESTEFMNAQSRAEPGKPYPVIEWLKLILQPKLDEINRLRKLIPGYESHEKRSEKEAQLRQQLAEKETDNQQKTTRIHELEQQVANAQVQLNTLPALQQQAQLVPDLQQKVVLACITTRDLAQLRQQLQEKETDNQQKINYLQELQQEIIQKNILIGMQRSTNQQLVVHKANLQGLIRNQSTVLEQINQRLAQKEHLNTTLTTQIRELHRELDMAWDIVDDYEEQLDDEALPEPGHARIRIATGLSNSSN